MLLATVGCGGSSRPRYTLQTVMFEVDIERKKLEAALLTQGGEENAKRAVEKLKGWFADPAIPYYLERTDLLGTPAQFRTLEASAMESIDAVIAAL